VVLYTKLSQIRLQLPAVREAGQDKRSDSTSFFVPEFLKRIPGNRNELHRTPLKLIDFSEMKTLLALRSISIGFVNLQVVTFLLSKVIFPKYLKICASAINK